MLKINKLFTTKIISIIVIIIFTVTSICYGIELPKKSNLRVPLAGNTQEGKGRFQHALLDEIKSILGGAVKVDEEKVLFKDETILLSGELYDDYVSGDLAREEKAVQVIIHELIKVLLQVTKEQNPPQYQSIKEIALNHLVELYRKTPQGQNTYKDEVLANDIWALIFEYRLMGIDPKTIEDTNLRDLLLKGYEIISARGDLFGEEFNRLRYAKGKVLEGLGKGIRFSRAGEQGSRISAATSETTEYLPKDIKRNLVKRVKSIIQVLDTPSSVIKGYAKAFVISLAIIFINYVFFRGIGVYMPEMITDRLNYIGFNGVSQLIIDHFKVDPANPLSLYIRWYFNDALIIPAMLSLYYVLVTDTGHVLELRDFPETKTRINKKEEIITGLILMSYTGVVIAAVVYHLLALWVMVLNPIISGFLASKLVKRLIPLLKQDTVVIDRKLQFKQSLQHGLIWITLFEIFAHVQNELLELRLGGTFDPIDLALLIGSAVISYVMIRILITHTGFPWDNLRRNLTIPKVLQKVAKVPKNVAVRGSSIGEIVEDLVTQYPKLIDYIYEKGERDKLTDAIHIFVNNVNIMERDGLKTEIRPEDVIKVEVIAIYDASGKTKDVLGELRHLLERISGRPIRNTL